MAYKIKNWARFQHYKTRRPPWIKLYRELLDDVEWYRLSGDASKTLVMLWIIASDHNGALPDMQQLCFRLRLTEEQTKHSLSTLSHWLEQDASDALADNKQNAMSEKRQRRDREETDRRFKKPTAEEVTDYAKSIGFVLEGSRFVDHYDAAGWLRGKTPIKDWKACVRTWKHRDGVEKKVTVPDWRDTV